MKHRRRHDSADGPWAKITKNEYGQWLIRSCANGRRAQLICICEGDEEDARQVARSFMGDDVEIKGPNDQ